MFPFGENMIDQHMRPIFDCDHNASFPGQIRILLKSSVNSNYISQANTFLLPTAGNNIAYNTRKFAIVQNSSFKIIAAQNLTRERFPSDDFA
jgi:hypothetical protein